MKKMLAWLKTCPYLQGTDIQVDRTDWKTGSVGLYGKGLQVVKQKENISGTVTVRYRSSYELYKVAGVQEDRLMEAQWLLDLQNWVAEQSRKGQAPVFGDVPQAEQIYAHKGMLKQPPKSGAAIYAVTITAEFEKVYEHI